VIVRGGFSGFGEPAPMTSGEQTLDRITGGAYTRINKQLEQVEIALKISTAAAVVSAVITILDTILDNRRR
jgi:hypothetical protein